MDRSSDQNRIVEYLRIKPISHSQIYTSQIAVPEPQRGEIPRERREDLRRSLIEQGSNLIPLIVRRTEAYSNEEEYEVVCGSDWCIVAKELGIEQMWAWVFEMTDEEVAVAQAEMEHLGPQPTHKTAQIDTLLQQFELSFQEKVDKMAKKIEQSSSNRPPTSAVISEVNLAGALRQLDELEKLLSIKLERTVQTINQFVSDAIEDVENDLKNQIETLRSQLGGAATHSERQPQAQQKTPSKTQPKKQSKAQQKPQLPQLQLELPFPAPEEDYESLSLRRLKAIGKDRKVRGYARMKRPEILVALRQTDGQ